MIVVSLTSFGKRIETTYKAIQSINEGNLKPSLIVVYLPIQDKDKYNTSKITKQSNTIIKWVEDYKSYKKFIGLIDYPNDIVVIADDDLQYKKYWLEHLVYIYNEEKTKQDKFIVCHRCQELSSKDYRYKPFICHNTEHFKKVGRFIFGSGSGVLFAPKTLDLTYEDIQDGLAISPHCDETYISALCLKNNVKMYCTGFPQPFKMFELPKGVTTLWSTYNCKEKDETFIKVLNHFGINPDRNVYVSLTSWKPRIHLVRHIIDLMLKQTCKPTKIILTLAECEFPNREIPKELVCDEVEVRWVKENYYTFKKLIPLLTANDEDIYIIIDDDVEYKKNFIQMMLDSYDGVNPVTASWLKTDYRQFGNVLSCNGCCCLLQRHHLMPFLEDIWHYCLTYTNDIASDPIATYSTFLNGYHFIKSKENYYLIQKSNKKQIQPYSSGTNGLQRNEYTHTLIQQYIKSSDKKGTLD